MFKKFILFAENSFSVLSLTMPSNRKKSPATEGKRKTRASDKARTTPNKKSKSASLNDGSYLQLQGQQPPVSTAVSTTTTQPSISASTGQVIMIC